MEPEPLTLVAGDPCPYCGKGALDVSASGKNLICPACNRVVIVKRQGPRKQ